MARIPATLLCRLGVVLLFLLVSAPGLAQQPSREEVPLTPEEELALDGPPAPVLIPFEPSDQDKRISIVGPVYSENNMVYGQGRTRIDYGEYSLEADRMIFDMITQEAQAEGDVIFRGKDGEVRGSAVRYNFRVNEGVAWGVHGRQADLYFQTRRDEEEHGPSFRRVSQRESLFRGAQFTGCNFPVPHYYVTASEVIIVQDNRVFFRHMVIWVRGVPLFYLPFYSRGFGSSPWSFTIGYSSGIGGYARLGYRYRHHLKTPDWNDPTKYRTRSAGVLDTHVDYYLRRGLGAGVIYRYEFDYERTIGEMNLYGIRDRGRELNDPYASYGTPEGADADDDGDDDDGTRWAYRHFHNSYYGRTIWQLNVDRASDPDIYVDFLDRFAGVDGNTGRLYEQRMRFALTYLREDWLARIWYDQKQRITRDRYADEALPYDDDANFDFNPLPKIAYDEMGDPIPFIAEDFEDEDEDDDEGIRSSRYARVRDAWSGRVASGHVRMWNTPIYSRTEFNVFHARDAGFNQGNTEDDAWVDGMDIYQSFTHRIRFSERVTWTNTVGVGAGYYERDEDLIPDDQFALYSSAQEKFLDVVAEPELVPPGVPVDGLRFADQNTVYRGGGTATSSLGDASNGYVWADYRSRLNARFTETLDGYIQYTVREGTDDSLGEFYESVGRQEARSDIYDFKTKYHWVEALLSYYLLYPDLTVNLRGGQNLQGGDDIYTNEALNYAGGDIAYRNQSREFAARLGTVYQTRQVRDKSDPDNFEQGSIGYFGQLEYVPKHGRWWALLRANGERRLDDDPAAEAEEFEDDDDIDDFNENDDRYSVTTILGGQVGPKHILELSTQWDNEYSGVRRIGLTIRRDLHDAELGLFFGILNNNRKDFDEDDDDDDDEEGKRERELEFSASLKLKMPGQGVNIGSGSVRTLRDQRVDLLVDEQ